MSGWICGTGSYVPSYSVDNHAIAKLVDTSDAWIRERTGVARRHIARDETTVSMACRAGRKAVEDARLCPEEIDLILVSTISSNVILPCAACEVQKELGAVNATCFDLNAACTGFLLAYNTALAYLESGAYNTALVIGSETLSNLTDWTDRGTCILFGDGAGAAVIRGGRDRPYRPVTHSDGAGGGALTLKSRHDQNGFARPVNADRMLWRDYFMGMDGQAVFKFAVKRVPEAIREVLDTNGVGMEKVSYYILHQANRRIVESVARRLGEPMEKFPMNLEEYGNTSSASIPILLDEMRREGRLKEGDKLVMAGFGAGLTWGASILEWQLPKDQNSKRSK